MNEELNALRQENQQLKGELEEVKRESALRKTLLSTLLHKYYKLKKASTNTISSMILFAIHRPRAISLIICFCLIYSICNRTIIFPT